MIQPEQNNIIGLSAKDCKDETTRADKRQKTAKKGQAFKAARTGQPEQGSQNRAARMGLLAQDCQHRAAKIRHLGQDKKERTGDNYNQNRIAGTGQPE
jgi:hypothetical protein